MALVSATEMLNKAHEGHYAVGAFNINNLEWTKMIYWQQKKQNLQLCWEYLKVLQNTCVDSKL